MYQYYLICFRRVSSVPHVAKNSMPASNLGIVFGPTLLRRRYVCIVEHSLPLPIMVKMHHASYVILLSYHHSVLPRLVGVVVAQ